MAGVNEKQAGESVSLNFWFSDRIECKNSLRIRQLWIFFTDYQYVDFFVVKTNYFRDFVNYQYYCTK